LPVSQNLTIVAGGGTNYAPERGRPLRDHTGTGVRGGFVAHLRWKNGNVT
jgi:hypothetical protein